MIEHPAFLHEPWKLIESELQLDVLAQTESIFALSNGHIGLRGNLEEGEPHGLPGTYLNSFCELRPYNFAESAYGQPESGQTVVNVTNGKLIRLLVGDEPFDVRYGKLLAHRRVLDMREGTLRREAEWESPGRRRVAVRTARLVSLTQRAVAAISYEVEAVSHDVRVVIQSALVANEELPALTERSRASGDPPDPRASAYLESPLVAVEHNVEGQMVLLVHQTKVSGFRVAALMDHEMLELSDDHEILAKSSPDAAKVTVIANLRPGQKLRFIKYLAYGWSSTRSLPALKDQVVGAAQAARHSGFEGLLAEQREYLDRFWEGADVEVEGDDRVQQAVRFGLFHVLQASARAEVRPIPAKGLTGPGYDGHAFWDTETFVVPVLTRTAPEAAADVIRWRHSTLPTARARAQQLGRKGAAFPWRTILGEECSGYWPASTAAVHLNADVADAAVTCLDATGDEALAEDVTELLVETARLWASLGSYDDGRGFRIDGVTGPDEYSALADNNVYTNLMAQANLRRAAELVERYPRRAEALGVGDEEVRAWRKAADEMVVPYDDKLQVHQQADGFTRHNRWDFASTGLDRYPLMLHYAYFDLYRSQVVKQADLVLALYKRGEAFSAEQKDRDFRYYEAITVRDSSLSAAVQSIVAAELGYVELAYDYLVEAALIDLDDFEHNTRDGLHMAALAGGWLALVAGLGGMRAAGSSLSFAPKLPPRLKRLCFRIRHQSFRLEVDVSAQSATYSLQADEVGPEGKAGGAAGRGLSGEGAGLNLLHYGQQLSLTVAQPVTMGIPPVVAGGDPPSQPPGRAPRRWKAASV